MRRGFTIVSIVVHTIAVGVAFVAEVTAVGPLPMPRTPVTFEITRIQLVDIKLPAPPRLTQAGAAVPAGAPVAAPIEAPSSVEPETGFENQAPPVADTIGVERGVSTGVVFGTEQLPPPPPQRAAEPTPVRIHQGMQAPRKVVHVAPSYPQMAQAARVEGVVILEATIDTHGAVSAVRVLRSIPLLDQAAIDAVRRWVFTPTLLNGTPVPVLMTVTVQFTLQER